MKRNNTKDKLVSFSVMLDQSKLDELKEVARNSERSLSAQARLYIDRGLKDERSEK